VHGHLLVRDLLPSRSLRVLFLIFLVHEDLIGVDLVDPILLPLEEKYHVFEVMALLQS
jgi:hypothetical protein